MPQNRRPYPFNPNQVFGPSLRRITNPHLKRSHGEAFRSLGETDSHDPELRPTPAKVRKVRFDQSYEDAEGRFQYAMNKLGFYYEFALVLDGVTGKFKANIELFKFEGGYVTLHRQFEGVNSFTNDISAMGDVCNVALQWVLYDCPIDEARNGRGLPVDFWVPGGEGNSALVSHQVAQECIARWRELYTSS